MFNNVGLKTQLAESYFQDISLPIGIKRAFNKRTSIVKRTKTTGAPIYGCDLINTKTVLMSPLIIAFHRISIVKASWDYE